MPATAPVPVQLPDLDAIRSRLNQIDREASFLRKLMRLVTKKPTLTPSEKTITTNTAR